MIRLAVRCPPESAEAVLANLTVLAPNGVEEEEGDGYVEYAIYGAEGEIPDLGGLRATVGDGLIEIVSTEVPEDWADRWQDFHRPIEIAGGLRVRPSWEPDSGQAGMIEIVIDPGRAFGTGAHATTRMCLELILSLAESGETDGGLTDLGTGSGVLGIAAAKLGWSPIEAYDHEKAALDAAAANATANGVELDLRRVNLRSEAPPSRPTLVANLTAPLLGELAGRLPALGAPRRVVLSGLLRAEAEGVAAAFAATGFEEERRLDDGDWTALVMLR